MTTTTQLKKLLFSMVLKTPIWLVHLAANQSSANEHTYNVKILYIVDCRLWRVDAFLTALSKGQI